VIKVVDFNNLPKGVVLMRSSQEGVFILGELEECCGGALFLAIDGYCTYADNSFIVDDTNNKYILQEDLEGLFGETND